jgi:putative aldouronate transport system permease protein
MITTASLENGKSGTEHIGKRRNSFLKEFKRNCPLFVMLLPGLVILIVNNYIPMFGIVITFQKYRFHGNFINSILKSEWVGFKNFDFFFATPYAYQITRNTILYNLVFIITGLVVPVTFAIMLNELRSRQLSKIFQSVFFLPYFLSWIIVSYLAYSIFSAENGFINRGILEQLGIPHVSWYSETIYWPFIIVFFQLWKYTGYDTVVYHSSISGIESEYYEAAAIDGASKIQQIIHITLPLLQPIMIIMSLLAVGRIFNADFGLFYNVPRNSGALYSVTDVIDTYVYRTLKDTNNLGMASAAGTYQAVVGCITVFAANYAVRKIDREKALF